MILPLNRILSNCVSYLTMWLSEALRLYVFKHPLFILVGIGLAVLEGRSATFVMKMRTQTYSLGTID